MGVKQGLIAGGALVCCLLFAAPVLAQTNSGRLHLTTSPLPISLKAKPGETIETELRIRNSGAKTERLKVGLMKFSAFGEEGKPRLEERAAGDNYFDWVSFSRSEFTAPPNEWQSIKMKIALPKSAAFGYYYAVTFTRATADPKVTDLEAAVRGGSATLVLLEADVPGAQREVGVQEFAVARRTYEFLPVRFSLKLKNTGNIHTAPTGTIYIKRGSKQLAAISVNSAQGNILPGSSRVFGAEWTEGFPAYVSKQEDGKIVLKDGQPVYDLQWDTSHMHNLRFGRYTAQLVMIYDDGRRDVPLEATVSFWVVPWRLIFAACVPVAIFGVLLYKYVRLRKQIKKLKGSRTS